MSAAGTAVLVALVFLRFSNYYCVWSSKRRHNTITPAKKTKQWLVPNRGSACFSTVGNTLMWRRHQMTFQMSSSSGGAAGLS